MDEEREGWGGDVFQGRCGVMKCLISESTAVALGRHYTTEP